MNINKAQTIVIIGAGPAGCSCALGLLNAGFKRVILLDNSKEKPFYIGESIPPDMNLLMRQLGIFEAFLTQSHEPCYGNCSYWGSEKRGYNDSLLSPHGHGWHLDRARFNRFLIDQCKKQGARVLSNTAFLSSKETQTGYRLKIRQQQQIEYINAHFVIDASGNRAVFALAQNSLKTQQDQLICLGLRFKNKGQTTVSKLTHLESVEHGWWYAASIPGEYLLVTLYTTPQLVKTQKLHELKNWINALANSTQTFNLVATMEPADAKLMGFNTSSFCLDHVVNTHWMAIGDAAATYDPITSQGITKAFTQGMRAAELLTYHFTGKPGALEQYSREVKSQFEYYQKARNYFYKLEQRWPQSPFWRHVWQAKTAPI